MHGQINLKTTYSNETEGRLVNITKHPPPLKQKSSNLNEFCQIKEKT